MTITQLKYVLAVAEHRELYGLAWLDFSSGRFLVTELVDRASLEGELARLAPAEIIIAENSALIDAKWAGVIREQPSWMFDESNARDDLNRQFHTNNLDGFGGLNTADDARQNTQNATFSA